MKKRRRNGNSEDELIKLIIIVTAIVNLIAELVKLVDNIIEFLN